MITARQAAYEVIYKVLYSGAYSNLLLGAAADIRPEERAFAARLARGVIERKLTLDYILSKFCRLPKPRLLVILEMGVYQLYFMEKVPESAAVNESVKLARQNALGAYTQFVNAVLRRAAENRISVCGIEDISVRYSVPQHLLSMWNKAYMPGVVARFLPALLSEAPVFAVPNRVKTTPAALQAALRQEGFETQTAGEILKICTAGDITKTKAFENGLFYIEDLSSYNAVSALGVQPGDVLLDLCAAPGGKSFAACILMENRGSVYAYDLHEHRVGLIKDGATRLGLSITPAVQDASVYSPDIPKADKIICDVPCSGFGVIRRKPEIKYKSLDDIKAFPPMQLQILLNGTNYLKAGGKILYSTCTLNKKENENVVAAFLKERGDFKVLESKTVFPADGGGDGFFYSILKSEA